jgi:hypothetical protein
MLPGFARGIIWNREGTHLPFIGLRSGLEYEHPTYASPRLKPHEDSMAEHGATSALWMDDERAKEFGPWGRDASSFARLLLAQLSPAQLSSMMAMAMRADGRPRGSRLRFDRGNGPSGRAYLPKRFRQQSQDTLAARLPARAFSLVSSLLPLLPLLMLLLLLLLLLVLLLILSRAAAEELHPWRAGMRSKAAPRTGREFCWYPVQPL